MIRETASQAISLPTDGATGSTEERKDSGSAEDLDWIDDLLVKGNGATRQIVVYEANQDLGEVMREIVEATTG